MVANIAYRDTTQWHVMQWAVEQGKYNTAAEQVVLYYLSINAFYTFDNPEGGDIGQVMRQMSYLERIQEGTGLSRKSIYRVLNSLQDKAYVQREPRPKATNIYGQQPHIIYVLWTEDWLRDGLRNGSRTLPQELQNRPTRWRRPTLMLVPKGGHGDLSHGSG